MKTRYFPGILTAALAAALVAAKAPQPGDRLTGTWDGTFFIDSAVGLPEGAPRARSTSGRLRFKSAPTPTGVGSERSVHAGNFEVDFARFGFELSSADAIGWHVGPDSVRIVLNPTLEGGRVELRAAYSGNTIVGTWQYNPGRARASGRFVGRRVRGG